MSPSSYAAFCHASLGVVTSAQIRLSRRCLEMKLSTGPSTGIDASSRRAAAGQMM